MVSDMLFSPADPERRWHWNRHKSSGGLKPAAKRRADHESDLDLISRQLPAQPRREITMRDTWS
jgi:hypothetical protein